MSKNEQRYLGIIFGLGVVAVVFLIWQIMRSLNEQNAQPTAIVDAQPHALTQTSTPEASATSAFVAENITSQPTQPFATFTINPLLPTDTPVVSISVNTETPTPEPTQVPIYIVENGDTLFGLALQFDVTVEEIKGANGLTDNTIYVGQKLVIPIPGLVIPTRTPGPPPPTVAIAPTTAPGATAAPTLPGPLPTATKAIVVSGQYGAGPIPGPSPTWSVYAFPTRFPASGPTKLGFHVTLNCCGVLDYVEAVHPPVMKGAGDIGYLKIVKELSPNTITIGRYFAEIDQNAGELFKNYTSKDPAQVARDMVNFYLPQYTENSAWVDYWEGLNEVSYPNYEWFATFEATRACEMQKHGLKAAIGGFSTGTPEPWQFEAFLPAIEAGIRCGAILTTHEYGAPTMYLWFSQGLPASYGQPEMPAYPDRGPLIGRYRYLYYNVLLPRGLNIPLVISETGIDGGAGAGQRPGYSDAQGWLGFEGYWTKELSVTDAAQFYVDQLAWYDSMLRQDSFVIGATIFNAGVDNTWKSFDPTRIIQPLIKYAQSLH